MKIICIDNVERLGGMGFRHSDVTIGKTYDCILIEEILSTDNTFTYLKYKIKNDDGRLVSKPTELFDTIEENRDKKLCQLDII